MSQPVPSWYKVSTSTLPFTLERKICSNAATSAPFHSIACFPWSYTSFHALWDGQSGIYNDKWSNMINQFSDAIAVGSSQAIYVFFTRQTRNPICYQVPFSDKDLKALPSDCTSVAWALHPYAPTEPLIVFSYLNLVYIFNVMHQMVSGYSRGHGGIITSIAVHPTKPNLFCTTSRDYSTRIYDLLSNHPGSDEPDVRNDPCWPPNKRTSFAGAAHGLRMADTEGSGMGRCTTILMGGRSGGHQAAVLNASFHPDFPLIATCGLDRLVKIWHLPEPMQGTLIREDKPLFSSSRIHKARVLSISWLQHDLLLSHCGPAVMKSTNIHDNHDKNTFLEAGQIVVWQWLSLDRFFPAEHKDFPQRIMRGCPSDYQESSSFKLVSAVSFPPVSTQFETPKLHLYQSDTHDPIVSFTYPNSTTIKMFNVAHLPPREPPPFPLDTGIESGDGDKELISQTTIPKQLSGWNISTFDGDNLQACSMGMGGTAVIGVGSHNGKSAIWIWRL